MRRPPGRLVGALAAVALGSTAVIPLAGGVASAAKPDRAVYTDQQTYTVEDLCTFPVTVNSSFSKTTQMTFRDKSGEVTRIALHIEEQDTFTANGETLTGLPYRFNTTLLFEDGELVHGYARGVVVRVPLPDGRVFRTAGRVDFVVRGLDFIVVPDTGTPGDARALCAALS